MPRTTKTTREKTNRQTNKKAKTKTKNKKPYTPTQHNNKQRHKNQQTTNHKIDSQYRWWNMEEPAANIMQLLYKVNKLSRLQEDIPIYF